MPRTISMFGIYRAIKISTFSVVKNRPDWNIRTERNMFAEWKSGNDV